MYFPLIRQMKKQLAQMDRWLEVATAHAKAKAFDPNVFLELRLAPDQFALARQVATTCDTLKLAAARLSGKEAPPSPEPAKAIEDLRAHARAVIAWIDTLGEEDFTDAAARRITQPRWEGRTMKGADYFVEHALPNFYFHLAHTYAILRHAGVSLGKRDYLGALTQSPPVT